MKKFICKSPPTKIIQLMNVREERGCISILALCEDGSIWYNFLADGELDDWRQVSRGAKND